MKLDTAVVMFLKTWFDMNVQNYFFMHCVIFSSSATGTGMIVEPVLHDVMVAGGSLVLSWESGNYTSSMKSSNRFIVSIVRYSSDLNEWFYQLVTDGESVSIDLKNALLCPHTPGLEFTKS